MDDDEGHKMRLDRSHNYSQWNRDNYTGCSTLQYRQIWILTIT